MNQTASTVDKPEPAATRMQWIGALSRADDLTVALTDITRQLADDVAEHGPFDVLFCFVSPAYAGLSDLPERLADAVPHRHLIGCTGGGVVGSPGGGGGAPCEIEQRPALGITAARLPGVRLLPFSMTAEQVGSIGSSPGEWERAVGVRRGEARGFVVLADPFSFPVERLTEGLDFACPGAPVVGGLASGARGPGQNLLLMDGGVRREGAVGLALEGNVIVDTVVAQGVRPVGGLFTVTGAEGQMLRSLNDLPVMAVLESVVAEMDGDERALLANGLFLGLAQSASDETPGHGDFLIRNVLGVTSDDSALMVGDRLDEGRLARFHLRDAITSAEDLTLMLSAYAQRHGDRPPAGGLMFSCLGRGVALYGEPNHDVGVFRTIIGKVPVGGFFCNGEIGPVAGATYLHGYTSVFALFHPERP
ncbi:MAG: FIST N-terminal domain-containing protein [Leptospirillia bacterium]